MKNLKILSMNLGRGFVPIKDKGKREYLMEFLQIFNRHFINKHFR